MELQPRQEGRTLVLEVFTISRFDMPFEIFPDRPTVPAAIGDAA